MATKKLNAVIEKSSDGSYGIYLPDLKGISLFGSGLSESEAKENLEENLDMFIKHCEEEKYSSTRSFK